MSARLSPLFALLAIGVAINAASEAALAKPPYSAAFEQCTPRRHAPCPAALDVLASANSAARQKPKRTGFIEARHIYSYAPGALYELYASPNFISEILLEPGESISAIAAGDTSRWMVTQTEGESEKYPRTIVLVKPQTIGLKTNIVLITDRRTYTIEANAVAGQTYSSEIAWSYPAQPGAASATRPFNFGYRIRTKRGQAPHWLPTRVYDDGRKTWIEFPPDVAAADMPPLFVISAEGTELVNYRAQGQRYVIDRVFDVAELRYGAKSPIIVRIDRRKGRGS